MKLTATREEDWSSSRTEESGTARSGWAYGFLLGAVVLGLFISGGPLQGAQGVMAVVVGLGMIWAPPALLIPRGWWVLGWLVVCFCALCFLPREMGYDPGWRRQLESMGFPTGDRITAHPLVSLQHWGRMTLIIATGWWILGHRLGDRGQARLLLGVAWATAVYAGLSIHLVTRPGRWNWDPVETFGLFANRSHTATLLVIGVLAAVTTAAFHLRRNEGGRAALATLPGMLGLGALLGYSVSRAGMLLLGLGLMGWLAGLAVQRISRRWAIGLGLVAVAGAGLFWFSEAEIKSRFARPAQDQQFDASSAGFPGERALAVDLGIADDGRWLIYRDTLDLVKDAWLAGIGLGLFEHVMPQYRRLSAGESRCLHPESDWLLLAAEAGVPCILALAALVVWVTASAARSAWKRRGWSLRWGGLVAALVVPVHGLFDTPGQLPVLSLLALLLIASTFRVSSGAGQIRPAMRVLWRALGAAAITAGVWLLHAEWVTGEASPVVAAARAQAEATRLYHEDRDAMRVAAAGATASDDVLAASDRRLRTAIAIVEAGLATAPLDAMLHYQRGMLALHFDDLDEVADQSFSVQRLLEPMPPGVALRQARGWSTIDPDRSVVLWEEAMRRADLTDQVSKWPHPRAAEVHGEILNQARHDDVLMRRALVLSRPISERLHTWARAASPALMDEQMPALLQETEPEARAILFSIWRARGTRSAVDAHEARE